MYKKRLCTICNQQTIKLPNHLIYEHGILYQQYCFDQYNIPLNLTVYLTPKLVDYILAYCHDNNIKVVNIKQHCELIFIQNKYDANKLISIFYQYTYAIAQYFNLNLLNIERNLPNMYKLKEYKMNKSIQDKKQQYTISRRRDYDDNVHIMNCGICGMKCNEKNLLVYVVVAHKISKKDYLIKFFNVPEDMNFTKLTLQLVLKMFEELKKSPYDNFKDCYQTLYDQVHNYKELDEKLGYKASLICANLNLKIHSNWTPELKAAMSAKKTGTKWSPLQRQRILEGKGILPKQ